MTNVAEPQVLPPQAPQAPGSLINNPSRIGLNVGPGTLVYRTSYGYLIVNPGGESIALSPSLNVIRQQTQLSNIRTTAVSQVVGTGGAIGAEGKPAAPTTTTEIVQSGGRAYEVVRDVYGNVVRSGSVVTPEAQKVPSPLTGQILTPSQALAFQKLPVGAPVSAVLPKPLQPTPVNDISRLQKLGFSTEGLTASYDPETGRLTTVQYPERISAIPSGLGYQPITVGRTTYKPAPPTEAEKYALYPTLKSTQDFSKAISEGAEKYLIPLVPYTPVGAVRPVESKAFVRGIVGGAASIPEFFATGALGVEYVGREIAAGRGKALPEALAIGAVEMGKGIITSFREKPIETTGQFIGQSLVFGGAEAGIREIKMPKIDAEGIKAFAKSEEAAVTFGGKERAFPKPRSLASTTEVYAQIRRSASTQLLEEPKPILEIPTEPYIPFVTLKEPVPLSELLKIPEVKPMKYMVSQRRVSSTLKEGIVETAAERTTRLSAIRQKYAVEEKPSTVSIYTPKGIQVYKPISIGALALASIAISKQIAKTQQISRQRTVQLLKPIQTTKQIQKTVQITPQIYKTVQITPQISRTVQISPQIAKTIQITPQLSKQVEKQIQQQEKISRQIEKQVRDFEIPEGKPLKLKFPSDATEQFFTRKRGKAKKKSRIQKVYAPVLNPLFDVVMQKASKTKPFKIIDITKKRKRR